MITEEEYEAMKAKVVRGDRYIKQRTTKTYPIVPVAKPRMTQRDKWLNPPRPCVSRYWAFKDEVRLHRVELPLQDAHVTFILPMPKSWSKKRRALMDGQLHHKRPDLDNCLKALGDACYGEDSCLADIRITKRWGYEGKILIKKGGGDE